MNKKDIVLLTNKMEPKEFNQYSICKDYLLVIFHSEILFSYDGVKYFYAPENSAIVYKPKSLQAYKSSNDRVLNSFLYMNFSADFFKKFSFPFNKLFILPKEYQEKILFTMDRLSYIINTPYAKDLIDQIPNYIEIIFNLLDDAYKLSSDLSNDSLISTTFSQIRNEMFCDPVHYTVREMAKRSGFSETYFGVKYKQLFKATPSSERKQQLVILIKDYLEKSNYSLEKIAELCNIKSVPYLINLFKEIEHITPHQYRLEKERKHQTEK